MGASHGDEAVHTDREPSPQPLPGRERESEASRGQLVMPAVPYADQAQYFYDELGRLVGVVDGSGNAAVYVYDEVGNLLSIRRFTTGTRGG